MLRLSPLSVPAGLYIHIPFCVKKCGYCDFFSELCGDETLVSEVLEQTLRQISCFSDELAGPEIDTIFIGGGTPSVLPLKLFDPFLGSLRKLAPRVREFTVEANPETVSPGFIRSCVENGVTRLSIGIQSFSDSLLHRVGRNCSRARIDSALEYLSRYWNGDVSFDLLCGIPGQGKTELMADLEKIVSLKASHLSVYALAIEEGTPLHDAIAAGTISPCSDETAVVLWDETVRFLSSRGYGNYEISNFAFPGKESLHNLGYWRMNPYIGCGPAAVSTLPGTDGPLRLHCPKDIRRFLSGETGSWGVAEERISPADLLFEHLMMGLRLAEGISEERIRRIFSAPLSRLIPKTISSWNERGYLEPVPGYIALAPRGRNILNTLLTEAYREIDTITLDSPDWPQ